jgi:hypothetical protein
MTARQIFKRAKFFVCWVVTVLAKATVWVLAIVVRWVSRVVCTVVQIVIGVFMAPFDEGKVFKEAVGDVWELVKDVFYSATGLVIYNGLYVFDAIQTVVGVQQRKRRLTPAERRLLTLSFAIHSFTMRFES